MDQKMGFSKKIVNSIRKLILFLTAYFIIIITASPINSILYNNKPVQRNKLS